MLEFVVIRGSAFSEEKVHPGNNHIVVSVSRFSNLSYHCLQFGGGLTQ